MKYSKLLLLSAMSMLIMTSKAEIAYEYDDINGVIYIAHYDSETLEGEAYIYGGGNITYENSDSILQFEDYFHGYPVTGIGEEAFDGCKDLKNVILPKFIKTIDKKAFNNCSNLCSIEINESTCQLSMIENRAFYGCTRLKNFDIPQSVTKIGSGAFYYSGLQSISIPSNVKFIDDFAFAGCHDLSGLVLQNGLDSIGDYAFVECDNLTSISIPGSVLSIGKYAFAVCTKLNSVVLSTGIKTIGNHAFAGCYELSDINIPDGVHTIGERAFSGAKLILGVWSPENSSSVSVACMEESYTVFMGSLRNITIGNTVTEIDHAAFNGQNLESVTCMAPAPPTVIPFTPYTDDVFSSGTYNNAILYVPRVLVNDYKSAYGWEKFKHIVGIEIMGNGDVNNDGLIDSNDLMILIDRILGHEPDSFNAINADIDGDGELTIKDVTALNDLLLANY